MSITPSIEGTDSHIDLDVLVRQTEKSFSDVEMDDAEAARVNQGEELEILPGRYVKWLKTSSAQSSCHFYMLHFDVGLPI